MSAEDLRIGVIYFNKSQIRAAILAVLDEGRIIHDGRYTRDVSWLFPRDDESDEETGHRMDFCDAVVKELTK